MENHSNQTTIGYSSTTTTNPEFKPYRPALQTGRSSNYAQAKAAYSSKVHSPETYKAPASAQTENQEGEAPHSPIDGRKLVGPHVSGDVTPSGASSWKPQYVRTQSWNEQDLKRELQMSGYKVGDEKAGPGFSEVELK